MAPSLSFIFEVTRWRVLLQGNSVCLRNVVGNIHACEGRPSLVAPNEGLWVTIMSNFRPAQGHDAAMVWEKFPPVLQHFWCLQCFRPTSGPVFVYVRCNLSTGCVLSVSVCLNRKLVHTTDVSKLLATYICDDFDR